MRLLERSLASPPAPPSSVLGSAAWDGLASPTTDARVQAAQNVVTRKLFNELTWLPSAADDGVVLIVGDSYCDHIDMGFACWPELVARDALGCSMLNVARGGSEARHARAQLERAHAFLAARQPAPPIRLLVVHTGGNDVVHSLPFAFPLLVVDLVRLALIRAGVLARLERPPSSFSFVGLTSRRIARDTRALLEDARARGHRRILLSTMPISAAIPLARALVRIFALLCGAAFISATLADFERLLKAEVAAEVAAFTTAHADAVELVEFDEAHHLNALAAAAGADSFGLLAVPSLVLQRWRYHAHPRREALLELGAVASDAHAAGAASAAAAEDDATGARFWHDAHHPAHGAHRKLAALAAAALGVR